MELIHPNTDQYLKTQNRKRKKRREIDFPDLRRKATHLLDE